MDLSAQQVIIVALTFFVGASSFAMGFFVYRNEKHKTSVIFYALMSASIGLWVIGRAFLQITDTTGFAPIFAYYLFIPPVLVALFLLLFSLYIGEEDRRLTLTQKIIVFVPWTTLFILSVIPRFVVRGVEEIQGANEIIYGQYFTYGYAPLLALYLLSVFPILIYKYRKVGYIARLQLRYVILGTTISVVIGLLANVILPIVNLTGLVWAGPLAALVLVALVGYAISRKKLWDFKLIFTELLVLLILIVQFAQIFLSANDITRLVFQTIAFVFMAIFSALLIREVFREIESRERVLLLAGDLAVANRRLQEVDAEKSDFVSIATHQLRTPLTVIKGYASMLLEGSFGPIEDENKKSVIQKIFDASERLVAMVEDFLDISRIEEGKMSYYFERIDISLFIDDIASEFRKTIKESDYRISASIEPNLSVIADKLKLRQVITNLLDNAMKYSPKGTGIEMRVRSIQGKIQIAIKDAGSGISKETMPKLFQKFSRGNTFSKLQTEGRGLGLYIAKQIMTAHGGRVWLESEGVGKGTTALLELQQFIQGDSRQEIKEFVKEVG